MKWTLLINSFLVFTMSLSVQAQSDSSIRTKLRFYQSSDSLSKFVRDNAPHYWAWLKLHKKDLGNYADLSGQVVGDAHFGNFNFLPIASGKAKEKMKAVVIDMDDGGKAALAGDFIRMVVNAKAIDKELRNPSTTQLMTEAYLEGLNDGSSSKPDFVDEIKDQVDSEVLQEKQDEFLQKHTLETQSGLILKLKADVLEKFPAPKKSRFLADVQKQLLKSYGSGIKVLDLALRPRDRGGSADALRFWALYVDKDGKNFIREFKQFEKPGVAEYQKQLETMARLRALQAVVFKNIRIDAEVVQINNALFWMRPKNIELIDVPYKPISNKEYKLLNDMMEYYSFCLGKIHGVSQPATAYVNAVNEEASAFAEMVEEVSANYISLMKKERKAD